MRSITILNPKRLVFGNDCALQFVEDFAALGHRRLFLVTSPPIVPLLTPLTEALRKRAVEVTVHDAIAAEPDVNTLSHALEAARKHDIDSVVGIGGGSALDVAKLVAALHRSDQTIHDAFGIGKLRSRSTYLACLPTTAGTGSEVSPNAILLDPADQLKKGVVSPHLVPDGAYVDPLLTRTVPPGVTAATGMDALTHCIEAYANKFAHPVVDLYALEGIRRIARSLQRAVENGEDLEAREDLALGSLFGGLCLGPVNTAAVHALAYPLGGEFHVAHGLSNAVLLPYVMAFNLTAAPERYAEIALALGVERAGSPLETARGGVNKVRELNRACGIPEKLSDLNVPEDAIDRMARGALTVTRLLKNNLRELTLEDARSIYQQAF